MTMFILWKMWYWWTTKRLLKKYNPEKDLARLAEEKRKSIQNGKTRTGGGPRAIGSSDAVGEESSVPYRYDEPIQPELLPTTNANVDGKTSTSNRKNGSSIGKLLRRRSRNN